MKKIVLIILILSVFKTAGSLSAQSVFSKVYYDGTATSGYSVVEAYDNGYVIAGSNSYAGLLMKIDSTGNQLWRRQFGNASNTAFNTVITTNDSSYVVAGKLYNTSAGTLNMGCMKVNAAGDTLWSKVFPGTAEAYSINQTFDNGFITGGYKNNSGTPSTSMVVAKITSSGNLQWQKTFTLGDNSNTCYSVRQTADSGYIVMGSIASYPPYDPYIALIRLSSSGSVTWTKIYNRPGGGIYSGIDVIEKNDGYLCYVFSNGSPALMKTDLSGNVSWCKVYGGYGSGCNCALPKLHPASDGGYVFTDGNSGGFGGAQDVIKVDSAGNLEWSDNIYMYAAEVIESRDRGYLVLGNGPMYGVHPWTTNAPQIGVVKTDSTGNGVLCFYQNNITVQADTMIAHPISNPAASGGTAIAISPLIINPAILDYTGCVSFLGGIDEAAENEISVFPNPFSDQVTVTFSTAQKNCSICIIDLPGKEVYNSGQLTGVQSLVIPRNSLKAGLYLLQLRTEKGIQTKKLIIQ
jgi:hypothetical protein